MRYLVRNAAARIVLVALAVSLVPVSAARADDEKNGKNGKRAGLAIPVAGAGSGATFAGTLNLQRFARQGDNVVALGVITGQVTNTTTGVVTSVVRNVAVPVTIGEGAAMQPAAVSQAAVSQAAVIAQQTCDVLNLVLGPLHLDLLGLVVDLNQVVLTIDAVAGQGNLLGNLLCAVAGLLDNPGGLSNLLNQILGVLQGV